MNYLAESGMKTHGRDARMLVELFEYIFNNPDNSQQLLVKLRPTAKPKRQSLIEKLVY